MKTLNLAALCIRQGTHVLYSFAVDGRDLDSFTTVSSAHRNHDNIVEGYQRHEILQHVREIAAYLQSPDAMLPNPIVVAFDQDRVTFKPIQKFGPAVLGTLTVPVSRDWRERCGFVVDGQQRRAAIRESEVSGFPILVSAFVAASEQERREQFILVNNTKPLPRTLIFELLPGTEAMLPTRLSKHKTAIMLLERLNLDLDSPLSMLVKTPTMPLGVIKDNSLLKGISNSLSDGVLHRFVRGSEEPQLEAAAAVLKTYWRAVSKVFPEDWARPPAQSRLMHGAGVVGMSFMMDAISENRYRPSRDLPTYDEYFTHLMMLKPHCRWSSGRWWFGREYRDVQNTPKDVAMFVDQLLSKYRDLLQTLNLVA